MAYIFQDISYLSSPNLGFFAKRGVRYHNPEHFLFSISVARIPDQLGVAGGLLVTGISAHLASNEE